MKGILHGTVKEKKTEGKGVMQMIKEPVSTFIIIDLIKNVSQIRFSVDLSNAIFMVLQFVS